MSEHAREELRAKMAGSNRRPLHHGREPNVSDAGEMRTDVAIVGGGLAGLALATLLHKVGLSFQLFEARPRFGGRVTALETPDGRVDLGPSWFWPGQPRMARLVTELGLRSFPQHACRDVGNHDIGRAIATNELVLLGSENRRK